MAGKVEVKAGDWFVEHGWDYHVRQAIRVTSALVFYMGEGYSFAEGTYPKEWRVRLDKIVFSCPDEKTARLIADRLTSSDALCASEERAAKERCCERNKRIIAEAAIAAATGQE